jgi:hypothetical protein
MRTAAVSAQSTNGLRPRQRAIPAIAPLTQTLLPMGAWAQAGGSYTLSGRSVYGRSWRRIARCRVGEIQALWVWLLLRITPRRAQRREGSAPGSIVARPLRLIARSANTDLPASRAIRRGCMAGRNQFASNSRRAELGLFCAHHAPRATLGSEFHPHWRSGTSRSLQP